MSAEHDYCSDIHLIEIQQQPRRVDWFKVVVWLGLIGYCWLFWYGVARAL